MTGEPNGFQCRDRQHAQPRAHAGGGIVTGGGGSAGRRRCARPPSSTATAATPLPDGALRNVKSALCLHAEGGATDSARLLIRTCGTAAEQQGRLPG
ncbi:hypothetical protein AB0N06_09875 [Streptomyces sp. NPDC051020]|uniref:hypothetical protein n=1 Tax=Streptomyces sp. NPDC051020 TaxID=3155409 RepID=UPI00342AE349